MEKNSYEYFQNIECEYFPCHKKNGEYFNCLFCYCPLYLIKECGGNYIYYKGVKDCSNCLIPHSEGGYDYINKKLKEEIFSKK